MRLFTRASVCFASLSFMVVLTSPASPAAAHGAHPNAKVIKMVDTSKGPAFRAPKTVKSGSWLRIVNDSDPKTIGPRTFTLMTRKDLPYSAKAMNLCEKLIGVRLDIAVAHKFDSKTGKLAKPIVNAGKRGWDKPFGKVGDTWFTDRERAIHTWPVSAKRSTSLRFFCVVHPFMRGKIRVVG